MERILLAPAGYWLVKSEGQRRAHLMRAKQAEVAPLCNAKPGKVGARRGRPWEPVAKFEYPDHRDPRCPGCWAIAEQRPQGQEGPP